MSASENLIWGNLVHLSYNFWADSYHGASFNNSVGPARAYRELDAAGFDQVPFCREHLAPERLKGFHLAPWRPNLEACRDIHLEAIMHFAAAKAAVPNGEGA
ncbi:MAG: hypothetical protein V4671_22400 [Armatimonadota bacterium]